VKLKDIWFKIKTCRMEPWQAEKLRRVEKRIAVRKACGIDIGFEPHPDTPEDLRQHFESKRPPCERCGNKSPSVRVCYHFGQPMNLCSDCGRPVIADP